MSPNGYALFLVNQAQAALQQALAQYATSTRPGEDEAARHLREAVQRARAASYHIKNLPRTKHSWPEQEPAPHGDT